MLVISLPSYVLSSVLPSSFPTFFLPNLTLSLIYDLCVSTVHQIPSLSFLFFALSDMSQDGSDEEDEQEEDFVSVWVQVYTAARPVCSVDSPAGRPVP